METMHKIQTLGELISLGTEDVLIDKTLSKLIQYKTNKVERELQELEDSIKKFESKYNMDPETFCKKFEEGELGDEMDFFEWHSLCDIQANHAETGHRKKRGTLSIRRYFDELKLYLVINPIVESVELISEKVGDEEGYLRVIIGLPDDSVIHCFEYVLFDESIRISKYSFHWQDVAGNLICRWDNAPHHPELDNFPCQVR